MANITFSLDSDLSAEVVLATATDFTESRPHYWPNIDPHVYKVHSKSSTTAQVTEGSAMLGGIWARESYDWSEPFTVRATVQDSNAFRQGGIWQLKATPRTGGGCHIDVTNRRQAKGFKGRVIGAMLTAMGAKVLPRQLQQTLDIVARESIQAAMAVAR
ncbi:MAG TPA: hypothetical protein VHO95_02270 [Candidatus Dormibacteraeota bacterium]|jgi:hypothetical protein|nr:hypothetical protein [Candidatus Dormibacteraeota bacterium]HEX2681753.1 hypothetical protein [Candidatus Dormibacteraeota bacterium]